MDVFGPFTIEELQQYRSGMSTLPFTFHDNAATTATTVFGAVEVVAKLAPFVPRLVEHIEGRGNKSGIAGDQNR